MNDIGRLLSIMAALRDPDGGCPWDREQTFETVAPYTLEEAYEVVAAIHAGDSEALCDELGDLLLQVVFHARMAEEEGSFAFENVVDAICRKMERRHPHVFGNATVESVEQQTEAWERSKADERRNQEPPWTSRLDGVGLALPAVARAFKLQRRAARAGFDWPDVEGVFKKLDEELGELRQAMEEIDNRDRVAAELGDLLFTVVNLARHLGVEPESALRIANNRFEQRFRAMERDAEADGRVLEETGPGALEEYWRQAKRREHGS